jgi:hypothetical protein
VLSRASSYWASISANVRFRDQLPVEVLLTAARLVACRQEDGLSIRIERVRHSPYAIRRLET